MADETATDPRGSDPAAPAARDRTRYVFVTGGVVSSLGKGITAASLGRLLKSRGLRVWIQKFDPYLNVDPGTMSPYQHGEVFVTSDGAETDLDLGHYERFVDENLSRAASVSSGRIYWDMLRRERAGDFLGNTIQIVPHVTDAIKAGYSAVTDTRDVDVVITEIGGTVGDIESLPFLEAIRQFRNDVGRDRTLIVHCTLVPYLGAAGELKTKPTQHSVQELRRIGLQPDMLVCRSANALEDDIKGKIASFCDVDLDAVISAPDADDIYRVPLLMRDQGLDRVAIRKLGLQTGDLDFSEWETLVRRMDGRSREVEIALVGKYVKLHDAYLSVVEALKHGGIFHGAKVRVRWVDSEIVTADNVAEVLRGVDGIFVPGGFGDRGIEGKIAAAHHARTNDIPYLGVCLGMQVAVVEFARNVAGMTGANSSEFDDASPYPVIDLLPEQKQVTDMGATMRLGSQPVHLKPHSMAHEAYGNDTIAQRHRHRYEVNLELRPRLEEAGLIVSGTSPDGRLVEVIELADHPFYVAAQYHPEFISRPTRPEPLFRDFVRATVRIQHARTAEVFMPR
ncbi:MAG: synthase [Thermoleophilia bacterium]|nr:synthase [Thermoleophilia bacterium]